MLYGTITTTTQNNKINLFVSEPPRFLTHWLCQDDAEYLLLSPWLWGAHWSGRQPQTPHFLWEAWPQKYLPIGTLGKDQRAVWSKAGVEMTDKVSSWSKGSWPMAEDTCYWVRGILVLDQGEPEEGSASLFVDAVWMLLSVLNLE